MLIVDMIVNFVVILSQLKSQRIFHMFSHALFNPNLFNWFFVAKCLNITKILYNLVQPSNSGNITMNQDICA